ncbi:protein gurken-like [Anopheles aquasalis]|uniref:protein gurken-like n=1 Tax=Anopheles aquasalis TaxID=42839 RepID=UPI00215AD0B9|nr:protein gurken-like [Anopheles aquasalis]XP_050098965.1 protein gurken-like [Anopheles aquasalis]XP_050098966.1 protein gurken-like [Anopheles aquasalis]XP_050098967.1 protein gurken-like [Anopheles aquasalis]XP_050098968.1 protein gurken-like [Anopheles aquasalis]
MNARAAQRLGAVLLLMLSSVVVHTDCCSSRTMPKARGRPVSHFRGVITTNPSSATSNQEATIRPDAPSPPIPVSPEATSTVTGSRIPLGGNGKRPGAPFGTYNGSSSSTGSGIGSGRQNADGGRLAQQQRPAVASPPSPSPPQQHQRADNGTHSGDNKEQQMRMGKCSQLFEDNYCLNGGQCYNFTIANSTMPTCECADGFMGERCESKYLDGTYLSMRKPKIQIETAGMYYGAFLAMMVVLGVFYYLHWLGVGARVFALPTGYRRVPTEARAWRLART